MGANVDRDHSTEIIGSGTVGLVFSVQGCRNFSAIGCGSGIECLIAQIVSDVPASATCIPYIFLPMNSNRRWDWEPNRQKLLRYRSALGDALAGASVSTWQVQSERKETAMNMNITVLAVAAVIGFTACGKRISGSQDNAIDHPHFAYVTNALDNTVSVYEINVATGSWIFSGGVATGKKPGSVAVDPSGRFVYVVNTNDNSISQYTKDADGSLKPMMPATVDAGVAPNVIALHPSGKYAYVVNYNGSILQYSVGVNGSLVPMRPATAKAVIGSNAIKILPSGQYAYVTNYIGNVSSFSIGTDGLLASGSAEPGSDRVAVAAAR